MNLRGFQIGPCEIMDLSEVEKRFKCPFCFERISMLLDISVDGIQTYAEDCEVCCHQIQITYQVQNDKIVSFEASKAFE